MASEFEAVDGDEDGPFWFSMAAKDADALRDVPDSGKRKRLRHRAHRSRAPPDPTRASSMRYRASQLGQATIIQTLSRSWFSSLFSSAQTLETDRITTYFLEPEPISQPGVTLCL